MTEKLIGILLAAGQSKRFGSADKLRVSFRNRPVYSWSLKVLEAVGCHSVVAAVDATNRMLTEELREQNVDVVPVSDPQRGRGHSLSCALRHAETLVPTSLIVQLADMPLVPVGHLRVLLDHLRTHSAVLTQYSGVDMPPFALRAEHVRAFRIADGQQGGRNILSKIPDLGRVALDGVYALDIDTPADLEALEQGGVIT